MIDTLATFVAKHGTQFEDMARARQGEEDEKFSFLFGGRDSGYYAWRVAQAKVEHAADSAAPPDRRSRPLGMEERARMLGEKPLPTSSAATGECFQLPKRMPNETQPVLPTLFMPGFPKSASTWLFECK